MNRRWIVPIALMSSWALVLLLPGAALADDVKCSSFENRTVRGDLNANLVVNRNCRIEDADVNGNVKWNGGYFLEIHDSEINGNLECGGKGSVAISDSEINGNIVECRREVHDDDKPWHHPGKRLKLAADLEGLQEVPAVSTSGSGEFSARIAEDSMVLAYRLSYEDLEGGDVRFAHIHFGNPGTVGGVIAFLCSNEAPPTGVDTPMCPAEGEVLQDELVESDVIGPEEQGIDPGEAREALRAVLQGATYVNVHTVDFPAGELRGQITTKRRRR